MCRVPKRSCLWMREREKNWSWQPESHMLFHTACWTIIYLFIFLCWHLAKHAPRCRHTKRSWEKKGNHRERITLRKKKFIYLKDTEWRERRLLCRRRRLLQILIQSLRRSLHELHFWSANKLGFFFLFYLVFPPVKIRGEIQVNNMHLFIFLSFFFFFSPFQSVSFPPTPQTQFFLGVHRLECFFSLPRSRLLFIRQQSFNLYH